MIKLVRLDERLIHDDGCAGDCESNDPFSR